MDGEAPAPSAWLDVFLIDNGAAPAGLASLAAGNGFAPVMPSGYTYKCYVGAMRVDGSGFLLRTLQLGNETQYVVQASGALPIITSTFGTYWTSQSVVTFVPPTATRIMVASEFNITTSGASATTTGATAGVAPNANYGVPDAAGRPPCSGIANMTISTNGLAINNNPGSQICSLELQSTAIFTGAAVTEAAVQ